LIMQDIGKGLAKTRLHLYPASAILIRRNRYNFITIHREPCFG
jgi:hypothetical protein